MEDPNLRHMNSGNSPLNGEYDTLITSLPNHQRANVKAESAVKIIQNMIIKCDKEGTDRCRPCEMMFERPTRPRLPKLIHSKMSRNPKREQRKRSVKRCNNKKAYNKPTLKQTRNVFFERKANEKWILGKIVDS